MSSVIYPMLPNYVPIICYRTKNNEDIKLFYEKYKMAFVYLLSEADIENICI